MSIYMHELKKPFSDNYILSEGTYVPFEQEELTEQQIQEYIDELDITNEKMDMDEGYGAKLRPVFITLICSGTVFTKVAAKFVKGQQYWHAALGFGPSLSKLYSYGHDPKNNHSNRFKGGFCFESIDSYKKRFPEAPLEVSCILLNDKKYKALKVALDYYIENKEKTRYDSLGLLRILFNKETKNGLKPNLVCSTFVDTILKSVDINIINKNSNLVKPDDLRSDNHMKQFKVYEGKIKDFSGEKLIAKIGRLANNIKNDYFYQEKDKNKEEEKPKNVSESVVNMIKTNKESEMVIEEGFSVDSCSNMSDKELSEKVNSIKDPKTRFYTALNLLNKGI